MGDTTRIAWTDHTLNPWIGCTKISPGCDHCYAETLVSGRMGRPGLWGKDGDRAVTGNGVWSAPRKWNREAAAAWNKHYETIREDCTFGWHRHPGEIKDLVFTGSLMDVFEDHKVPRETRPAVFQLIRETPALSYQLLTKRAGRIESMLPDDWGEGYPNVWLGVSIESDKFAWRAEYLRKIPASVRFISYEPALGPLAKALKLDGIDWVIFGGESGPGYRQQDTQWARDMMAKCEDEGVAFFYKQSAAPRTEMGIELDGKVVRNYPAPRLWTPPSAGTTSGA